MKKQNRWTLRLDMVWAWAFDFELIGGLLGMGPIEIGLFSRAIGANVTVLSIIGVQKFSRIWSELVVFDIAADMNPIQPMHLSCIHFIFKLSCRYV